jgi:hypothetical protein
MNAYGSMQSGMNKLYRGRDDDGEVFFCTAIFLNFSHFRIVS